MAEVKKMRKFYKPGESAEDRKKAIAERMKVTACHNCGEVGHWSRECPKASGKTQNVYVASSGRSSLRQRRWLRLTSGHPRRRMTSGSC